MYKDNLFFNELASQIHASKSKNTFLFVHGYCTTFSDAAKQTAQISYDLRFDGTPVFYSWPSQGELLKYFTDEQNIEWAQKNLKNFIKDFFLHSHAKNVYLIAHSLGSRALTRALITLFKEKPTLRNRLKEVILAAPDIDAEVFKQDIAPALAAAGRPVTLYASASDRALSLSKFIHGYPRAGDSKPVVVFPGVETIDVTAVNTDLTDLFKHGYYAKNRSVLEDISTLISTGKRADERFYPHRVNSKIGTYWEFKP